MRDASALPITSESGLMRIHQKLLIAAIVAASAIVPVATSDAQGISISIGDRGYYRGSSYWHRGSRVYWVPGYWGPRRRWIHGRYVRRSDPYYRSYYRNRGYRNPGVRVWDGGDSIHIGR